MQKLIIILLLGMTFKVNAQTSLIIKLNYQPNHIYEQTDKASVVSAHYFRKAGSPTEPSDNDKPALAGTNIMFSDIKLTTKTSAKRDEKIPFSQKNTITVWWQQLNGERNEGPGPSDKSIVYGYFKNTPLRYSTKVDSIQGPDIDDKRRSYTKSILENYSPAYPLFAIKIGDSFELKTKEEISFGSTGVVYFDLLTRYTLTEIKNGVGYFTKYFFFKQKETESSISTFKLSKIDNGSGTFEYDMKNCLVRLDNSSFGAVATLEKDNVIMTIHTTVNYEATWSIKK